MSHQLSKDLLDKIFEFLDDDKVTLYSCLLVNHLWSKISVRFLWRNIRDFKSDTSSQIISILIACLSNHSKDLLRKNGIFISTPKDLMFDYASFCEILSIGDISKMVDFYIKEQQPEDPDNLNRNENNSNNSNKSNKSNSNRIIYRDSKIEMILKEDIIIQEILKMFINKVSLKKLTYCLEDNSTNSDIKIPYDVTLTHFSGARDCLKDVTELSCTDDVQPKFFFQLSKVCHNIQSLIIRFQYSFSNNGLKELISSQNCLKYLSVTQWYDDHDSWAEWTGIIPSLLKKHSNNITKLHLNGIYNNKSLSFITKFTNLQELNLSFDYGDFYGETFMELGNVTFKQLQILSFQYAYSEEIFIKFLENNGENLKEFYFHECNNSINLAIAKFCLNLKSLYTKIARSDKTSLKVILTNCKQLESLKVVCDSVYTIYPEGNEVLNIVAKYSPKNLHELILHEICNSRLLPEELEYFFIIWKNRTPLTFIIESRFKVKEENMEVIEKYKKLGVIKKFEKYDVQYKKFS
ncbi:hypothetical protein C1645_817852 [Glomus cerebriforme]|uniref:F-box domain-containing protein n=1 Tax=Glomus cerebriforme TaxID=658196 RepID=A0A397TIB1_9GLOM|nr:hypothetical protein C1645_817852 [Glomus cerebriforme]